MKDYEPTQEQFDKDMATWTMEALRDDGLYRHLRFRLAGGGFRWFDIVTWPCKLVITGDCETFAFTSTTDMFEFFRQGGQRINPGYWQEKIVDGRERAVGFDADRFRDEVRRRRREAMREWKADGMGKDDRRDAWEAIESEVIEMIDDRHEAVACATVSNFDHYWYDSRHESHRITVDTDEWPRCRGFDFHYIWCCRAIAWAIAQYDAQKGQTPT